MSEIMGKGFTMLYRDYLDDPLYFSERFTRSQAFIDLCFNASYSERTFRVRGNKVELKRGQLAISLRDLSVRWKWSVNTVVKFLNDLKEDGYIDTQKTPVNQIITIKKYLTFNTQTDTQNNTQTDTQTDTPIIKKYKDNKDIKEEDSKESKKKQFVYPQEYENDFLLYGRKGSKKNGFNRWKDLTEDEKEKMRKHIPYYLQSNDRQYLKDFEGYINQRLFESPVYKGSELLFDPMQSESSGVYCPKTDGVFQWWDDKEKCLHFNGYIDMLDDGYTADNRPDGAKVKWQMYNWIWSSTTKEWIKQQ